VEDDLTPAGNVFAACLPPPEVVAALATELERLPIPGRRVPPANYHVTLRFLGPLAPVTYERFLAGLAQSRLGPRFRVRLAGLGSFPHPRRATVVWAGVEAGPELAGLAAVVDEAAVGAGLEPEERPFAPHLTVARVRPPADVTALAAGEWRMGFEVREVRVMAARGSRYHTYATFPL
jgi:2'-5' RNA ligase